MGLGHNFALIYKALYALGSDYPGNSLPRPSQLRWARTLLLMIPILKAQEIRNGWFWGGCVCVCVGSFWFCSLFSAERSGSLSKALVPRSQWNVCFTLSSASWRQHLWMPPSSYFIHEGLLPLSAISWAGVWCHQSSSDERIFKSVQEKTVHTLPETWMELLQPQEVWLIPRNHVGSRLYFSRQICSQNPSAAGMYGLWSNTVTFAYAFISTKIQWCECGTRKEKKKPPRFLEDTGLTHHHLT